MKEYLAWDDWRILGRLADGEGGEHGERLRKRDHYRLVHRTKDFPKDFEEKIAEEKKLTEIRTSLGDLVVAEEHPKNKWYSSTADVDIPVVNETDLEDVRPLSEYSHLLRDFVSQSPTFLFARPQDAERSRQIVKKIAKVEALEVVIEDTRLRPATAKIIELNGGKENVGQSA